MEAVIGVVLYALSRFSQMVTPYRSTHYSPFVASPRLRLMYVGKEREHEWLPSTVHSCAWPVHSGKGGVQLYSGIYEWFKGLGSAFKENDSFIRQLEWRTERFLIGSNTLTN